MRNELNGINKSGTGIHRSGTGIHRSGTGIHRSGTGIHRSGTGIKKGGTGRRLPGFMVALAFVLATFSANAFSSDPDVFVSERNQSLMLSLHSDAGIFVGAVPLSSGQGGYFQVDLHQVAARSHDGIAVEPLVKGTGTGNSGEDANLGGETEVKGTGTGSSGEAFAGNASTLVKGTGTGNSGESVCGASTPLVKGTGTGSSGEAWNGCGDQASGLMAELVIDQSGTNVIVRDRAGNEVLVAFIGAQDPAEPRGAHVSLARGFVAAP